ncbi:hypothetical protein HanXRQr2_Chr11g0474951 [Helianthus annuus]|uniref:Uncharacterized protein n=1 Tax=Helianthus annuus TaxID=4232 RepID=A0A9K3MZ99_HELAN|nr:hypothetical protein HanXRQr2_Chr11g0474951 [Helianthus annuus]KAJ0873910.1 hypothetical protein HanPSC8_Chr11g0457991 [Helianthus annuus]
MRYLFIHSYLQQLLIKSLNATVDTNQQAQSFVEASLNQRLSSLVLNKQLLKMDASGVMS